MAKTAPLSIRITPELKAEIEKLAKADKRPVASYVEIVLQAHVEAQRKTRAKR
jgi:predicted DNA-binding protein